MYNAQLEKIHRQIPSTFNITNDEKIHSSDVENSGKIRVVPLEEKTHSQVHQNDIDQVNEIVERVLKYFHFTKFQRLTTS